MNSQARKISKIIEPQFVREGAGVKLKRSFPISELDYADPFLLFDHFGSDNPEDYLAGFPMHPHRGIETVTYMLTGTVDHKDSIGNAGRIGAGDVQWMTSGRGIMHEEMPKPHNGKMEGFQLWVNLPAKLKMTKPRYQEFPSDQIPEANLKDGSKIQVIAGTVGDARGPVSEIAADPAYLDVFVPADGSFCYPIERGHTAIAYVFEGEGVFGSVREDRANNVSHPKLIVFDNGDLIEVHAKKQPVRFLLIAGKPLYEPIARYGPFVMNTQQEIQQALEDLKNGTFV
ncbi:MAG: pirin family protein [Desulfobacterales bacterium]|jgi:redox-sensitive bicupin YhaK (pirin superfamily)